MEHQRLELEKVCRIFCLFHTFICAWGVTKRRRLSWLTNNAPVYESKCGGGGGWGAGPQPISTTVQCAHAAQIHFGDLIPHLTYGGTVDIQILVLARH
jgi:hypothetical protein